MTIELLWRAPMHYLRQKYTDSPEFARIAPFGVFVVLTCMQEMFGPTSKYWVYLLKTAVGAWMLWEARPFVPEMRWKISLEAVLVGAAIFGIWVGLDGFYPRLSKLPRPNELWNPFVPFGQNSGTAWFFVSARILGMSLVVPPLEEIFYRSFLYRYFVKTDFRAMSLGQFHALSFAVTSILFGIMHPQWWVAGILCGLGYQWLVVRKNRLGDAMTAHAITNFLLGVWVIWKHDWNFF